MPYISENAVIDAIVAKLKSRGLEPRPVYAGRRGIDILVSDGPEKWAIEAKGGTGKGTDSNAFVQVSTAVLTALKRLNEENYNEYHIGIAIPDGVKFFIHIK